MDEYEIRKNRNYPIKLKFDLESDDPVLEIFPRPGGMFVVSKKKILRLRTHDHLDANMKVLTTPWEQSVYLPFGHSNKFVARTIIQHDRIIKNFYSDNCDEYKKLSDISWELMNSLSSLNFIHERLEKQVSNICEIIQNDPEKYVQGDMPSPLPIVEFCDIEVRTFINEVKRSLDTISTLFDVLSDLKFGMTHPSFDKAFSRGHFHKARSWVKNIHGDDCTLAQMLVGDKRWIDVWIDMRIAIEHPKDDKYIEVLNFALEAERSVRLPTWRFIHPKYPEMSKPQNLLDVFEICINNLLKFYEDLSVALLGFHEPLLTAASGEYQLCWCTIPEENRDPDLPIRYELKYLKTKD